MSSFIFIAKHNFSLIHLISGLVFDVESKCLCLHWELISLTTLFHVQIRIYMNITQSERDIVKCVCKSMYLATSPATRWAGSGEDLFFFPLPRCFHPELHANKIEVLIKGFKQLAYFHRRARLRIAASPPKESNSRPLSTSPRSGLKALTTAWYRAVLSGGGRNYFVLPHPPWLPLPSCH